MNGREGVMAGKIIITQHNRLITARLNRLINARHIKLITARQRELARVTPMASPSQKLAQSLEILHGLQNVNGGAAIRAKDMILAISW
jgi:hypothetical protein